MTPTIGKAQDQDLFSISRNWKELVEKAKNKKLSPAEYSSGDIFLYFINFYLCYLHFMYVIFVFDYYFMFYYLWIINSYYNILNPSI